MAAATRLQVPPQASSAAPLGFPNAFPARSVIYFASVHARKRFFCSPANLRLSPPVNISRGCHQATDDEEALPHIIISSIIIGGTLGCSYISTSPSLWRGADHVAITSKLLRHLFHIFNFLSGEEVVRSSPGMVPMAAAQYSLKGSSTICLCWSLTGPLPR